MPDDDTEPASGPWREEERAKSMTVFKRFIRPPSAENPAWDAREVTGAECFAEWRKGRAHLDDATLDAAAKIFQRNLTGHLTGADGRAPFSPEEEQAILAVVRLKKVWSAFESTPLTVGLRGFRSFGYWEKQRIFASTPATVAVTLPPTSDPPQPVRQDFQPQAAVLPPRPGPTPLVAEQGRSVAPRPLAQPESRKRLRESSNPDDADKTTQRVASHLMTFHGVPMGPRMQPPPQLVPHYALPYFVPFPPIGQPGQVLHFNGLSWMNTPVPLSWPQPKAEDPGPKN